MNLYQEILKEDNMKFTIEEWKLIDLYKRRNLINFPVYQREIVWFEEKKRLLIDSIFRGIDIPKLYLQKTEEGWDCIDGHQRINSIVGFFDEEFEFDGKVFKKLTNKEKEFFENYKLTIAMVDDISEEEIRLLFLRLQLGVSLNSGEKLNAISSNLGEFVKKMTKHSFMKNISIPSRRFAKEQVCAQICNNSIYINKTGDFINSKYEDLENLYKSHRDFDLKGKEAKNIMSTLDKLNKIFGNDTAEIRNRASVVSIYLFVEEMIAKDKFKDKEKDIRKFYLTFLDSLQREVKLGIDFKNRFLVSYQSKVIQAADSKNSIKERHQELRQAFEYYLKHSKIIGYD